MDDGGNDMNDEANVVHTEGNEPNTVQDVIDWLSILEPSQLALNRDGGPFSCLDEFGFVPAEPAD